MEGKPEGGRRVRLKADSTKHNMASGRYTQLTLYRRLLLQARPYWIHMAGTLLLNLATAPLALLTPLPMKLAVDSVIGSQPMPGFVRMLAPRAVQSSNVAMLV